MVTLVCAIVGAAGSAFSIDIDTNKSVDHLKDAMKAKISATITCDANVLQLFLAKKGGAWLSDDDPAALELAEGETHPVIQTMIGGEKMRATKTLQHWLFDKNKMPQPSTGQIHVLVWVVPPQQGTSAPSASQDGVFDHCSDPFFSQFPTVDQVGDWLEFSSLLPLTERQQLYVRSSYQSIAAQALVKEDPNRRKYAVVTGTPGVGKSVFVYYVMWRLVKEGKRVLFITSQPPIYFDGLNMWDCCQLPYSGNRQFWSPDLWCLVDSEDPTNVAGMPIERVSVLLASIPRRDCISEFKKKVPTPVVLYMPVWSKEELSTVAPLYPDAQGEWEQRFRCLGGVPRTVLQDIQTNGQVLLEIACNTCSLEECKTFVSINLEINARTKAAQTLIHIRSEEPYREMEVVYASELAMKVIARAKLVSNRLAMERFLSACNGNPLAQMLCGYIFEPYCMRLLHKGGRFEYRELLSNAEKKRKPGLEGTGIIEIPASSQPTLMAERVEVDQLANQLYVPRTSNFVAIDAWMPQFGGFQMTVGKKHGIKGVAADNLEKLGESGNRLFFLIPPLYYDTFTKKEPMNIKQFAVLVPYPEEV